jgi:hypothetical protein
MLPKPARLEPKVLYKKVDYNKPGRKENKIISYF